LPHEANNEAQFPATATTAPLVPFDPEESLETLRVYKEQLEAKVRDLDTRLSELN
jgi:hypothetical protein